MNIMFWNLHKNDNTQLIVDMICENAIDIALFAEFSKIDFDEVLKKLENRFHEFIGPPTAKTFLICREKIDAVFNVDHSRFSIFSVNCNDTNYIIAGVHFTSAFNGGEERRKLEARQLSEYVNQLEAKMGHTNTILIGDFNANPFANEMILKDGLNAVLFKELIINNEFSTVDNQTYRRFYNPMVHFISENQTNYGSIYFSGSINDLYWNSFDQVLVRKTLVHLLDDVKYLKQVKGQSLLVGFKPSSTISDHLPLIVRIQEGEYGRNSLAII